MHSVNTDEWNSDDGKTLFWIGSKIYSSLTWIVVFFLFFSETEAKRAVWENVDCFFGSSSSQREENFKMKASANRRKVTTHNLLHCKPLMKK